MHSGYRITFDNETDRNVIIFCIDHSSSSQNELSVWDDGLSSGINERFGSAEKTFIIDFTKANTIFCLSLHYNADNSYFFVDGNEI